MSGTSNPQSRVTITTKTVSTCCAANVLVGGHTTKHYECEACGQPCDATEAALQIGADGKVSVEETPKGEDQDG